LEIKLKKSGIAFRLIPAGEFKQVISEEDQATKPKVTKMVKSFYMGKFEITQQQWKTVMKSTIVKQNLMSKYKV
jgi:formylglycine-generating enzyme required for sulfatase activity